MIGTGWFNRSITAIGWCFILRGVVAAVNVIGVALDHLSMENSKS